MAKLDALKEKLAALKQKLTEKLEKVPFLKKLLSPGPVESTSAAPAAPAATVYNKTSLGQIYSGGGILTRLQVFFFYLFLVATLVSGAYVGKRVFKRMRETEQEKVVAEVSTGLGDIKRRMEENASVLSLGKFTVNSFIDENRQTAMSIDIWLKVSSVETANFVQNHEAVLHDKMMDAMSELFIQKVNLLTETGKVAAKKKITDSLNSAIPKGKVEEVFFYNMVSQ
ncbi:MAG: flagellar basal body-associated FliL family protein [Bdellovibrionota bacterium]